MVAVGQHRLPQFRGEEDESREVVDVVLNHGVAHLHDADEMGVDAGDAAARSAVPKPGRVSLLLGVEAGGDDLADVQNPSKVAAVAVISDLVGTVRVGHAALGDRQAVLVEELPGHAGNGGDRRGRGGVDAGGAVGEQRGDHQGEGSLHVFDAGQVGDLRRGGRREGRRCRRPTLGDRR